MSGRTKKDVDALLRAAKRAGFLTGQQGTQHRVINPLTAEYRLITRAPSGVHGLENQKKRLSEIGFTPGMTNLLAPPKPARRPAAKPTPTEPPTEHRPAEHQTTEHHTQETPMTATADVTLFPAQPTPLKLVDGTTSELPIYAGEPTLGDLPTNCWHLWAAIHDYGGNLKEHTRDGVAGVLWTGVFGKVIAAMWPDIPAQATAPQQAMSQWLRGSGNMVCLKPHARPPLWWLSTVWVDALPKMGDQARPVIEVVPEAVQYPPVSAGDGAVDELAVFAKVLERARTLGGINLELEHANEALERTVKTLRGDHSELKTRVSAVVSSLREALAALDRLT